MYGYNQYASNQYAGYGHYPGAYVETFDDEITVDDDFASLVINFLAELSDTVDMVDDIVRDMAKTFIDDTITLTEAISKTATRELFDILSYVDDFVRNVTRILSDIFTPEDSLSRGKGFTVLETVTPSDSISESKGLLRTKDDEVTITDTHSRSRGSNFIDIATLSEAFNRFHNGLSTLWIKTAKAVSSIWIKQEKP